MTAREPRLAIIGSSPCGLTSNFKEIVTTWSRDTYPAREWTLSNYLPEDGAMPEQFERVAVINERWYSRSIPWSDGERVQASEMYGIYTPEGSVDKGYDNIVCQVVFPPESYRSTTNLEVLHDIPLYEEFGGEPSLEVFTDWVKADLTDETVDGNRRTTHWRRVPHLYTGTWLNQHDLDMPCWEFSCAIETVEGGVLIVGAITDPATTEKRAQKLVDTVIAEISAKARLGSTPSTLRGGLSNTTWTDLTDEERDRSVRVACETPTHRPTSAVSVIDQLDELYGAPEEEVESRLAELQVDVHFE